MGKWRSTTMAILVAVGAIAAEQGPSATTQPTTQATSRPTTEESRSESRIYGSLIEIYDSIPSDMTPRGAAWSHVQVDEVNKFLAKHVVGVPVRLNLVPADVEKVKNQYRVDYEHSSCRQVVAVPYGYFPPEKSRDLAKLRMGRRSFINGTIRAAYLKIGDQVEMVVDIAGTGTYTP